MSSGAVVASCLAVAGCQAASPGGRAATEATPQDASRPGDGPALLASDGQRLPFLYGDNATIVRALRVSGARDLACPLEQVTGQIVLATDIGQVSEGTQPTSVHYVAEGCGHRAAYIWVAGDNAYRAMLVEVAAFTPPASPRSAATDGSTAP